MDDIISGKGDEPGLIKIVSTYLDAIKCDDETRIIIDSYLQLIKQRVSGGLSTTAQWFRNFVNAHPGYKHDPIITDEVCRDVLQVSQKIAHGKVQVPDLLNDHHTSTANVYISRESPDSSDGDRDRS
eukprot:TRINITY_DN6237_c0_g1_i1.p1 TRINITY_DN6237_c0_g1~~TRINITY_DN6237_c0_g1_i1.p1  ORF type:complete len:143 (-),score=9.89 TRINITY_DN6237_c0_g1_i1:271-651(-)